jgi:adhesin/invasin
VFGSGLSGAAVEVAGISASVAFSSPFQLNAIVPAGVPAGSVPVRVRSALGDVIQQTLISRTAPGIFMLGDGGAAVTNQDGTLNRPASPERRGRAIIIYLTGLGATERRGALDWAVDPVRVTMAGRELTPIYAGLTPGFPGLYQVNVLIPSDFPPGLRLPLRLSQAGAEANLIEVSIQ